MVLSCGSARRVLPLFVLAAAVAVLVFSAAASASEGGRDYDVRVFVEGEKLFFPDRQPFIDTAAGRTMVPIRALAERLGWKVKWDEGKQEVRISKDSREVRLRIGGVRYWVISGKKEEEKVMEAAPAIIGDRTYIPLRAVAEGLGEKIDYKDMRETLDGHIVQVRPVANLVIPRKDPFIVEWLSNVVKYRPGEIPEKMIREQHNEYGAEKMINDIKTSHLPNFVFDYDKYIDKTECHWWLKMYEVAPRDYDPSASYIVQCKSVETLQVTAEYCPEGCKRAGKMIEEGFGEIRLNCLDSRVDFETGEWLDPNRYSFSDRAVARAEEIVRALVPDIADQVMESLKKRIRYATMPANQGGTILTRADSFVSSNGLECKVKVDYPFGMCVWITQWGDHNDFFGGAPDTAALEKWAKANNKYYGGK